MYKRQSFGTLISRVKEPRKFIQVLSGPRQAGKTTLVQQVIEQIDLPVHYASADDPALQDKIWIEQQWEIAKLKRQNENSKEAVLVLDEIQKISGWSDIVKKFWDADTRDNIQLKLILLGSAPLLIKRRLTESLAGRFEIIPITHWSYSEMKEAFNYSLDHYIYFGGYPGASELIRDEDRWRQYILNSLIETTISRDILLMNRVDKPVLLRRLFQLGCEYSGQILSFTKMLGQLHDAGNTTTLSHYLELLSGSGVLTGIQKYAGESVRKRASSPKFQILNTGLMNAMIYSNFKEALQDRNYWGRVVESAVGAHLINTSVGKAINVYYWRERNAEVDFVIERGDTLSAIEVRSTKKRTSLPGMNIFAEKWNPKRKILVGSDGFPLEEFLSKPAEFWL